MSLQLRKMNLIEYLLGVQDEKVFDKIESTIQKSIKTVKPGDIIFTKSDLIDRAEFSNKQINHYALKVHRLFFEMKFLFQDDCFILII